MFLRLLLCLALALTGVAARAETELHVVGVYAGHRDRMTRKVTRAVPVTQDRPGAEVVLVLFSFEGVDREVATTPGTAPPSIVLSQVSRKDAESTIRLNGVPEPNPRRVTLPLTWRPEGEDFRELVRLVPDRFGVDRMASYSGSYNAPEQGFVIDRVVPDDRYAVDYLRPKLARLPLPESLRRLLPPPVAAPRPPLALTETGFVLTDSTGQTRTLPLPPDLPRISWPVAAVRDEAAGMLYGAASGGNGILFAYAEARHAWRVLRGLDRHTADGMILDRAGQRLSLALTRYQKPGLLVAHDLTAPDDAPLVQLADLGDLPGLSDLYDPGNGPAATLVPVGIEGDRVLIVSTGTMLSRAPVAGPRPWRACLADLATGKVDFVGYEGGIAGG